MSTRVGTWARVNLGTNATASGQKQSHDASTPVPRAGEMRRKPSFVEDDNVPRIGIRQLWIDLDFREDRTAFAQLELLVPETACSCFCPTSFPQHSGC